MQSIKDKIEETSYDDKLNLIKMLVKRKVAYVTYNTTFQFTLNKIDDETMKIITRYIEKCNKKS